jgi:sucrose-phosphate synthase
VLPARAGKGAAMAWVARRLGVAAERVLATGDSGNDLDMLAAAGLGVIVGRSSELAALDGRPNVRRARASFADGVLEALRMADAPDLAAAS